VLELSKALVRALEEHALRDFPRECCGLLIGAPGPRCRLVEVVPLHNQCQEDADRRYVVDPLDWLAVGRRIPPERAICGVYHSHPRGPAIPSLCDQQGAHPGLSYLIVALAPAGEASGLASVVDLRSWRLADDGRLREEALEVVEG
jgi:proteasome lid subunit RPN8/RPN11